MEYEIVPEESFLVIQHCSGCRRKSRFKTTQKFRVNANGNKLDVWLIYQCETCRHTLNVSIYERQRACSISKQEYAGFLNNEESLAEQYGRNIRLFKKNKLEIDMEDFHYCYVRCGNTPEKPDCDGRVAITLHNPCGLKIRVEKQVAEILGLSRSQVKKHMEQGEIKLEKASPQHSTFSVCDSLVPYAGNFEGS